MARRRKKSDVQTIEEEVLAAVPKIKRKKKEKEQSFLLRIVKAIAQLDEEAWDELSEEAQDWYDNAAEAVNESEDVPEFSEAGQSDEDDEDEEDDEEEEEEDDEEEDEDEDGGEEESLEVEDLEKGDYVAIETDEDEFTGLVTSISSRGVVTLKPLDGDKVKIRENAMTWISKAEAPPEKKKSRSRSRGGEKKIPVGQSIREVICKYPTLSEEKVAAKLKKGGLDVNASTLRVVYRDTQTVIALLKAEGWKKAKK